MSANLKRRIERAVAEQTAESDAETVSEAALKSILSGNAGIEPSEVEAALDDLVADGTLTRTDDEYRLASEG